MKPILITTLLVSLSAALLGSVHADITIPTVTVGDPGNANDPFNGNIFGGVHGNLYGGVNYTYAIGTTEVTLTQYTGFLNAVAQTDTYGLYNAGMTDPTSAGISQAGSSGSYTYSVLGSGARPVTYVSWYDAARFTNWLHNGQPEGLQVAGTTEDGAYTLAGNTGLIAKNANATFWIPSEHE